MLLAAVALFAGCGGDEGLTVQVVAPDAVLRSLGEACAGGDPFLYAHATADYSIADSSGKVVSKGALPEGKAVAAFNHDPGVERVPTFCSFSVKADVAPSGQYTLHLGESAPRTFTFKGARAMVVLN